MDRTQALNHVVVAGKRLFRDRDIVANLQGTSHMAADRTAVQEELLGLIEALGLAPDPNDLLQLLKAAKRIAAGNAGVRSASAALTPDHAGVMLVSAATGNVVLTLPRANAAGGAPLRFTFVRTDNTGNGLTIVRASTDLIEGTTGYAIPGYSRITLVSDGSAAWVVQASVVPPAAPYSPPAFAAGATGFLQLTGNRPGDLSVYLQWGVAGGGDDVPGSGNANPSASFYFAFPNAVLQLVGTLVDGGAGAGVLVSSAADRFGVVFTVSEYATAVQSLGVRYFAIGY